MPVNRRFVIAYDYDTGALWEIVYAPSKKAITDKFPELEVFDKEPEWMSDDLKSKIESTAFLLDDQANYPEWIKIMIHNRLR